MCQKYSTASVDGSSPSCSFNKYKMTIDVKLALATLLPLTIIQLHLILACEPRDYGHGSIVCVCSAAYCDFYEGHGAVPPDELTYSVTSSDIAGLRFELSSGPIKRSHGEH
jgi:hypothetical protein